MAYLNRRQALRALLIGVFLGWQQATASVASGERVHALKAAFVYNFTKYVTWPDQRWPDSLSPFSLCIIGSDPIATALRPLTTRSVNGRPIHVHEKISIKRIKSCHLLIVGADLHRARFDDIIRESIRHSVLTISDQPEFARRSGVIQLLTINRKVRFNINLKIAIQSGLTISSRLLNLANSVIQDKQP